MTDVFLPFRKEILNNIAFKGEGVAHLVVDVEEV